MQATKKLTLAVMNSIKVLAKVEEASAMNLLLAPEVFYNQLISDKMDMQDHYLAWRQSQNNDHRSPAGMGPFSFCSFPFLLNAKAKTRLLQVCIIRMGPRFCFAAAAYPEVNLIALIASTLVPQSTTFFLYCTIWGRGRR
jgi:hypothetical protein